MWQLSSNLSHFEEYIAILYLLSSLLENVHSDFHKTSSQREFWSEYVYNIFCSELQTKRYLKQKPQILLE